MADKNNLGFATKLYGDKDVAVVDSFIKGEGFLRVDNAYDGRAWGIVLNKEDYAVFQALDDDSMKKMFIDQVIKKNNPQLYTKLLTDEMTDIYQKFMALDDKDKQRFFDIYVTKAYLTGTLPLNTLANKALEQYEMQKANLSAQFERELENADRQEENRNTGMKR